MSIVEDTDFEKIIGDYLLGDPGLSGIDARVSSVLPTNFTKPWVRVTQLDAINRTGTSVEHLIEYALQFDCYAGSSATNGRDQASALSRIVRSALKLAEGNQVGDVTISSVDVTSHLRLPDQSFDPWRERYVLDVGVYAHG